MSSSRKQLLLSTLSITSLFVSIIAVASDFAVIEQKNPALDNELVKFTFDLFQFCRKSETFDLCSRNGPFEPCSTLSAARSATASFLIMMIIVQFFWVFYLVGLDYLSVRCLMCRTRNSSGGGRRDHQRRRNRTRQRRQRQETRTAASDATTTSSSGAERQEQQQQSNQENQETASHNNERRRVVRFAVQDDSTSPTNNSDTSNRETDTTSTGNSCSCLTSSHKSFAQFVSDKQNFRKIFTGFYIITLFLGFLGWSIAFSLTSEPHCGKKVLDDFVVPRHHQNGTTTSAIITESRIGPVAPVALTSWVLQILTIVCFWKFGEGCGLGDDDQSSNNVGGDNEEAHAVIGEYQEVV